MPTVIKRCISLLLILMLVVSLIPSVYAAETADEADPAASTETTEETMNTEPEENMIPPPNETEAAIAEEPGNNLSEADIIDDSEPPVMLLIDGKLLWHPFPTVRQPHGLPSGSTQMNTVPLLERPTDLSTMNLRASQETEIMSV